MSAKKIVALIPAAGNGSRMRSELPKQYLKLAGQMILDHSLTPFIHHPAISQVIVCLSDTDKHWIQSRFAEHKKISLVTGGKTRAESVRNGLQTLKQHDVWVMVHDAARPCLQKQDIDTLLEQQDEHLDGVILACPSVDSLKQVNQQTMEIQATLERETIWRAQTPQFFHAASLLEAINRAFDEGLKITDEASAMLRQNAKIKIVESCPDNLKVTTPADLLMAETLLLARQQITMQNV